MKKFEFIKKVFKDIFLSIVNPFIKKEKSILFIPHENCESDDYDIFSYSSDNVLTLFADMIKDTYFNDYKFYVVYYNIEKELLYKKMSVDLNRPGKIVWLHKNDSKALLLATLKCSICFTNHIHYDFQYKRHNQVFISLGYFTPFKNDYFAIRSLSPFMKRLRSSKVHKSFDFYITTSDISSRITSIDTLLDYSKFKVLGYPRNDIFYKDVTLLYNKISSKIGSPKHIVCYTPTFRDYEKSDLSLYNAEKSKIKSILGIITQETE